MLRDMSFERETCLFRFDPGLINRAAQLVVCFSRRRADLTVQRGDARRKRDGAGIVFCQELPLLLT